MALTGPEQILGSCWLSLSRAAPRPVQQILPAVGRYAPGRSVRWGNLRTLHPVSGCYGHDRGTPVDCDYIERFLPPEQALRNVWASIAPGGALLITVPTLGRLDPYLAAADFWRWTPGGLAELLGRVGMPVRGTGYGNMLACLAAPWRLSVQDLSAEELDVNDSCSPLIARAHADKLA